MTFAVLLTAGIVLIADGITKAVAMNLLSYGESLPVIPGAFHLTLVLNKGAAFGVLAHYRLLFVAVSVFAIIAILAYILFRGERSLAVGLALGLVLGGASGNLVDRIRFGYVIDFFDMRIWPVFNVADSCITVGCVLLGWHLLVHQRQKKA